MRIEVINYPPFITLHLEKPRIPRSLELFYSSDVDEFVLDVINSAAELNNSGNSLPKAIACALINTRQKQVNASKVQKSVLYPEVKERQSIIMEEYEWFLSFIETIEETIRNNPHLDQNTINRAYGNKYPHLEPTERAEQVLRYLATEREYRKQYSRLLVNENTGLLLLRTKLQYHFDDAAERFPKSKKMLKTTDDIERLTRPEVLTNLPLLSLVGHCLALRDYERVAKLVMPTPTPVTATTQTT